MADTDVGWAHADAIHTIIAALPYTVHIGEVTGADDELEYPYLVVWPPPANRQTLRMNGYGGEATTTTQITAAGRDPREVITALDRASALLHRRRPDISGRACGLITQDADAGSPPQPLRDEQARTVDGRPVFFSFLRFTLHSTARTEEP